MNNRIFLFTITHIFGRSNLHLIKKIKKIVLNRHHNNKNIWLYKKKFFSPILGYETKHKKRRNQIKTV